MPYPGEIQDVQDNEIEVKVMHKIGKNRYFWPMMDDILYYTQDKLVTLLDSEPQLVTKRHRQICPKVWDEIEKYMNL